MDASITPTRQPSGVLPLLAILTIFTAAITAVFFLYESPINKAIHTLPEATIRECERQAPAAVAKRKDELERWAARQISDGFELTKFYGFAIMQNTLENAVRQCEFQIVKPNFREISRGGAWVPREKS